MVSFNTPVAKPPAGSTLLFDALADAGRIKPGKNGGYRMLLKGVDEIDWFTDRPDRVAGTWSPERLVKKWDGLFGDVEPNAQATFEVGGKRKLMSFEMFKPFLNKKGNKLNFDIKGIGSTKAKKLESFVGRNVNDISLFIDSAPIAPSASKVMELMDPDHNGTLDSDEIAHFLSNANASPGSASIENHALDNEVTQMMSATGVSFTYTPKPIAFGKPGPGTLTFGENIVRVGLDDAGDVLSFICPQRSESWSQHIDLIGTVTLSGTSEVEVGKVGGWLDPVTGAGTMYGDDMAWKFWGDLELDPIIGRTQNWSISKDEAAFIPIRNFYGGTQLALDSLDTPNDGAFSSYNVQGVQGATTFEQKGFAQELIVKALNLVYPGFPTHGTHLEWDINLQDRVPVSSESYASLAHDLHMG